MLHAINEFSSFKILYAKHGALKESVVRLVKYLNGGRQTIYFGQNFKQKANKFHSLSTNQIKHPHSASKLQM